MRALLGFALGLIVGAGAVAGIVLMKAHGTGDLGPVAELPSQAPSLPVPSLPIVLQPPTTPAASESAEQATLKRVANHRFWKVRLSPQQVDGLVTTITSCSKGDAVFVDEQFHFARVVPEEVEKQPEFLLGIRQGGLSIWRLKPSTIEGNDRDGTAFVIDLYRKATRPSRMDALTDILASADVAEFRRK